MQFRKQKTLIQVMKYDGYDKATKQPKMAMVGTIDLNTFHFDQRTSKPLDPLEQLEIRQAIEREQLNAAQQRATDAAVMALEGLRKISPQFDLSEMVKNNPDAIWTGIVAVEKALKAGGHEKPKKTRAGQDSKTGDLLKV